jgi:hypothetical protein
MITLVQKAKGPAVKRILVRCPSTAKLTVTGQTVREELWPAAKIKNNKLSCSHCGRIHVWTKKDVVLAR